MASINTDEKIVVRVIGKTVRGKIVPLDGGTLSYASTDSAVAEVVDELGITKLVGKAVGSVAVVVTFSREGFEDLVTTSESVSVTEATVATIEVEFGEIEPQ